jgi:hypothetical protein
VHSNVRITGAELSHLAVRGDNLLCAFGFPLLLTDAAINDAADAAGG